MEYKDTNSVEKKNNIWVKIFFVFFIVVMLIALVWISLANTQRVERDISRLTTIAQIRSGLEMYYLDNVRYPEILSEDCQGAKGGLAGCCLGTAGIDVVCDEKIYFDEIKPDPQGNPFIYNLNQESGSYIITFALEGHNGDLVPGFHKATPFNISE